MKQNKFDVSVSLIKNLIFEQFSQWKNLPIKEVEVQGWDNRTFRLGSEMLIRMPSAECYAVKVEKEQKWLPILAKHLSIKIPEPIAMGKPSKDYPWNWSIYKWIEGKSANTLNVNEKDLENIAKQVAQFLNELHKIDTAGAPSPGKHNFYRGGDLSVYDKETRSAIEKLKTFISAENVLKVWEKALGSAWNKNPIWIHGDLSAGNILIQNNRLVGIIDFGGTAVGDPACDLVIAWTFLKNKSRKIFKANVNLDNDTWTRARGWALWKAVITLDSLKDKTSLEAFEQKNIIEEIISKHELDNY